MRKTLLTLSFCCGYFLNYCQEAVKFHLSMKPGMVYRETIRQKMNYSVNYDSSSQEFLDFVKRSGKPNSMEQGTMMEMHVHTGKSQGDGIVPIRMDVVSDSGGGQSVLLPPGTVFYGWEAPGKMPIYDSLVSGGAMAKQTSLGLVNGFSSQLSMPDTELRVGQSYTQVLPVSMPIAGGNVKMVMKYIYTLNGFSVDTAGIDINIEGTFDGDGSEKITGATTGAGKMVYSRMYNYPIEYQVESTLKIQFKREGIILKMLMSYLSSMHCTISPE